MKTIAAVLVQTGKPLELADLEIPALEPGQVLVEIAFSGVCHTQLLECRGKRGEDRFLPHCLGHEASGTVIDVGREVRKCRPGDRVILSWIKGSGSDVPGTKYRWQNRVVNAGGVTTFSRHAVVSENRVTVAPDAIEPRDAALIGCAVATGVGAVMNAASVGAGQSIAIFGMGGIGLCALMATVSVEANPIVAVDINWARLAVARELGATHTIDATAIDANAELAQICRHGFDVAIESSGRVDVMRQALAAVRARGGAAVIVGNAPHGDVLSIDPQQLNQGRRLVGTWGGDTVPDRDFPRYCQMLADGKLHLDRLRDTVYPLREINAALDDFEAGRVTRPLIDMQMP